MSGPAPVVLVELGRSSAWLGGDMGVVHGAIRAAQVPKQYDRTRRAVAVPRSAVDDVLAAVEMMFGGAIEIVEALK